MAIILSSGLVPAAKIPICGNRAPRETFPRMATGKHIVVLGDQLRRFYEYLMADAKDLVDRIKRRPEWQKSDQSAESEPPKSAVNRSES